MKKYFLLCLTILLTACAANRTQYSAVEEIQEQIQPNLSTWPAYDLTGGVWVKGQPLLINHEFDFGMAMGIPDVGPGIAAGNRKKINEETARLFDESLPFSLSKSSQKNFNSSSPKTTPDHITLYGILFGQPNAQLKVVLEIKNNQDIKTSPLRFVYVTEWFPVKGENSWSADKAQKVVASFQQAIPFLIGMWQNGPWPLEDSPEVEYTVTKGGALQRGTGWILSKEKGRVLIKSKTIPNTIILYPESTIEIKDLTVFP